jgi:FkbM family methyltransferase
MGQEFMRRLLSSLPGRIQAPLRKLWHQVDLVAMPRRKLASFARAQYYRSLLHDINIDCVIDVGANEGHFAEFLRHDVGYSGPIVSFEPVAQVYNKLRSRSIGDPRWEAVRAALGDQSGNVTVNIAASSVFSSILKASSDGLFNSLSRQVGQEQVPIYRLDSFALKFSQFRRIFLKTDTQGFDLSVLHGAKGLLNQIDCIQVELSFEPLYHDMPTWRDVLHELEKHDYALSNMFPIAMTKLRTVEFDCIVVKKTSTSGQGHCPYEDLLLRRWRRHQEPPGLRDISPLRLAPVRLPYSSSRAGLASC